MNTDIKASVGRGGENRKSDTRIVQKVLNAIYPSALLVVDGLCGRKTIARIKRFQRNFMAKPDGRVDPGGRTIRRMIAAAPAVSKDWSGDSSKWSQEKKIESLHRFMRGKVSRTIDALKAQGFKPKIVYAWRSVAVQKELFDKKRTKVRFSFHNAQYKNGTPAAYAADIIDRRWAWSDEAEENGFWEALGKAAKAEELYWGGDWRKFKDWAHVQFYPNTRLSEVRRESGVV